MKRMKKSTWMAAGIPALALAACNTNGAATEEGEIPIVVDDLSVIADGRLNPIESAQLSFSSGGEIIAVLVKEGDSVVSGQPLVQLGNREQFQAALAAAGLDLVSVEQALDAFIRELRNDGRSSAAESSICP